MLSNSTSAAANTALYLTSMHGLKLIESFNFLFLANCTLTGRFDFEEGGGESGVFQHADTHPKLTELTSIPDISFTINVSFIFARNSSPSTTARTFKLKRTAQHVYASEPRAHLSNHF